MALPALELRTYQFFPPTLVKDCLQSLPLCTHLKVPLERNSVSMCHMRFAHSQQHCYPLFVPIATPPPVAHNSRVHVQKSIGEPVMSMGPPTTCKTTMWGHHL